MLFPMSFEPTTRIGNLLIVQCLLQDNFHFHDFDASRQYWHQVGSRVPNILDLIGSYRERMMLMVSLGYRVLCRMATAYRLHNHLRLIFKTNIQ